MKRIKVANVVGARPNFMKIAPIYERMKASSVIEAQLVHTGQHYDHAMSDLFFKNLGLPEPDHYLGVGSGGHGEQTGKIMIAFEAILRDLRPDMVLVVGDVNSTIACGLVAVKLGIKLVHVEAGLRSYDRTMPEEVNRVLTDQISDYLFTTERLAQENLEREGINQERIFFVGNVMIDALLRHRAEAAEQDIISTLGLVEKQFALVTLHRPANVDDSRVLGDLIESLCEISKRVPVLFPVHPRTRVKLAAFGLEEKLHLVPNVKIVEPLGYLSFLRCTDSALFVVTDSGGIQEETTVLDVPCITARENTERPVTVTHGTNVVVGRDPKKILEEAEKIIQGHAKTGQRPELWDGHAAERIVKILVENEGCA